ncbi:alpha/beta fold hydrolase [Streptomyces sp. NPDC051664]|uniref:alpha/beta fold hydrolase n=1 Tax=Streptomyces sp. NPDC051664 TaxID=3365668 RepID=UPI0037B47EA8
MEKCLDVGDAQIAFTDEGEGDAVLLLHGSFSAGWLVPAGRRLVEDGHRVLNVHRAGYGQSKDLTRGVSVAAHAQHAVRVTEAADLRHAHVVGHSSGASVALQLAHARPDLVRSLVLLEAAFPYAPDEPKNPAMARAVEAAREGDYEHAFDLFLGGVSGPDFRKVFVRELGEDDLQEAVASSQYFFTAEGAAFAAWSFGSAEAATVTAPVLLVVGGEGERLSTPHRARSAQLASWLPHSETRVLPGVSHAMPLEDPALIAGTVEEFVARHNG